MMSPQHVGPVEDPLELERERAANCCDLMATQADALADMLRKSPATGPWLAKFADALSSRADADFEKARVLRGGRQEASRPRRSRGDHLRVVR